MRIEFIGAAKRQKALADRFGQVQLAPLRPVAKRLGKKVTQLGLHGAPIERCTHPKPFS